MLGLLKVWLITFPDALKAPAILPEIAPIVQLKLLGTVAVREYAGLVLLHVATLVGVITGSGFTLTVMDVALPLQPCDEVGVTRYCTVPATVLAGGLVKV